MTTPTPDAIAVWAIRESLRRFDETGPKRSREDALDFILRVREILDAEARSQERERQEERGREYVWWRLTPKRWK